MSNNQKNDNSGSSEPQANLSPPVQTSPSIPRPPANKIEPPAAHQTTYLALDHAEPDDRTVNKANRSDTNTQ